MSDFAIGDLIAKEKEFEAYVEAETKAFDERMKPYTEGIKVLKNTLLAMLQEQNLQNFKSYHGTAYQQTILSVKVDNKDAFLDFVVKQGKWDMLNVGAAKEPVQAFLDANAGVTPPGIKVDYITKCNIRS